MTENLLPFLIAAGVGFAIGIERERRFPKVSKAMGIRTFILLALLGALAGFMREPLMALSLTFLASALIVIGYLRTTHDLAGNDDDIGLTTEVAAGVTFSVGYIAHIDGFISALIGLITLAVLLSRKKLHEFSVEKIKTEEIQAAVILFALGLGVLPLLSNEPIDPWGVLNIHRFVMLLVLIGGVQFLGYLATRIFGAFIGFPLAGFIAGFVSSTAVLLTMPLQVKNNPKISFSAAAASILATVATFLLLLIVIGAISMPVFFKIATPILVAMGIGLVGSFFLGRHLVRQEDFPSPKNPLSLVSSLKLAALLSGFMIAIAIVQHFTGERGAQVASFIAGLGELHGVSIASASMFASGKIDIAAAQTNILLAAMASLLSKFAITWVLIRGQYAIWVTLVLASMLAGFLSAWMFL